MKQSLGAATVCRCGLRRTPPPPGRILRFGSSEVATLERSGEHRWTFFAEGGEEILVEANSEAFDTYLEVVGPNERSVGADDDGGEGTDSRLSARLPTRGEYSVIVRGYEAESRGRYSVSLRTSTDPPPPGRILRFGSSEVATLERSGEHRWTFFAEGGEEILVEANSEAFDTYLEVVGPNERSVGADDDGGEGTDSRLSARLPTRGEYSVIVRGYEAESRGRYSVSLRTSTDPPPAEERIDARGRRGASFRDCDVCPEMVPVPVGDFVMGSPVAEYGRHVSEGPRHQVSIGEPFAVGAHEVSFEEWDACVRGGGCNGYRPEDRGWGRGQRPVINVNWPDARAYVQWLTRESGRPYRLLSESEWEYVARAGTSAARYWDAGQLGTCEHANADDASVGCQDGYFRTTAPVGSYRANALGVYDVLGNVWEWVDDCWNDDYRGAPDAGQVWRAGDCGRRVRRGGSGFNDLTVLRAAARYGAPSGAREYYLGFRVARALD